MNNWQNELLDSTSNKIEKNILKDLIVKIQFLMKHERIRRVYKEENDNE